MVIRSEFRMEQYGVDDHREDASHFRLCRCQGNTRTEVRELSTAAAVKKTTAVVKTAVVKKDIFQKELYC